MSIAENRKRLLKIFLLVLPALYLEAMSDLIANDKPGQLFYPDEHSGGPTWSANIY